MNNRSRKWNGSSSPYLSSITLNVNRLNSSIRRHRMTDWGKKDQNIQERLAPTWRNMLVSMDRF